MASVNRKTIFVVDDEVSIHKTVTRLLKGLTVDVHSFGSAEACLKDLLTRPCHLIITDVNLPKMDGIEFLKQARVVAPWLPVLVATGFADVPMAVKALKIGASDFIEKPLVRDSFLASVTKLLEESGHPDERLGKTLTKAERRILSLVLSGHSSKDIAGQLFRSVRTVELHRQHIMRKLGVSNVVELVQLVNATGWDMAASSL
jgi:two-component system response regulator FixJ